MFTSSLRAFGLPTLILLLMSFSSRRGFAGQFDDQCRQAGTAAVQSCRGAVQAAKAAESAQASSLGASAGNAINPNSGIQGSAISAQQGRLGQAQSTCQTAKQTCTQKCNQAQQQAQSAPDEMTQKPPHSDAQKIPGTKASSCEAPIDSMLGELGQAQSELGKDGQGTDKTKDASQGGGQPPSMSPPKGGDNKKEDQQNPQPQQNQQQQQSGNPNCDSDEGARYSDCNDRFIQKCSGTMNQSGCESFGARYCGSGSAAAANSGGLLRPSFATGNNTGLVLDKRGEGLGSGFCRKYSAFKFCQQSGRGSCPSCLSLAASSSPTCLASPESCMAQNSPDQLERARSTCPSDPIFADPSMQKGSGSQISTQSVDSKDNNWKSGTGKDRVGGASGTGAMGGSGSGSSLSSSASANSNLGGSSTNGTGLSQGSGNSMDVGASGGSGGYSSGGSDDSITPFRVQSHQLNPKGLAAKDTTTGEPLAVDVSRQQGPSLFSISTSTYQSLCQSRRLNCKN